MERNGVLENEKIRILDEDTAIPAAVFDGMPVCRRTRPASF